MKLFGSPESAHALKVKFFMQWANIPHKYEFIDIFSDRETRNPEFLKFSKFAQVPMLIDGGKAYIQSNAILMHLADKIAFFKSDEERQRNLEWLMWETNKIGMCLPQLRAHRMFDGCQLSQGAYDWLHDRYIHDVNVLNDELKDQRRFILGDAVSPADFSLCAYLMYAEDTQVDVPQNVERWLQRLKKLNGWQDPFEMLK